jgi:hypothetical protein
MKKGIVIIIIMTMITGAIYAQSMPAGSSWAASAQSEATQGRFRSTMDNFIRPDSYSGVSFDKFYAMGSFNSAQNAQFGYATKFSDIYLGIAYAGNFWANVTDRTYTEGAGNITYNTLGFTTPAPQNLIAVLVGMDSLNMGFRLAFYTDYETFSDKNVSATTGVYTGPYGAFEAARGQITPQFGWAMTKNLMDDGVKPWATLALGFHRNNAEENTNGVTSILSSQNYFEPVLDLGLGGYNIKEWEGGFRLSADVDYRLAVQFYSNDYSYEFGLGKRTGSVSGIWDGTDLTENSYVLNRLTPSLSGQWSGDIIAFKFKFNLPFTFINTSETELSADIYKRKDGSDTSAFTFLFNPNVQFGMQWNVISKLAINAGLLLNFGAIQVVSADVTTYTNGVRVGSGKTGSTTFGAPIANGAAANQLSLGVTFTATDNVTFEASSGIAANNNIRVFDPADGIFSFTNIGVSLKF